MSNELTDDKADKTCAHPGCSCLMQEEEDFCSEYCDGASGNAHCGCEHLACIAKATGEI